MQFTIKLQTTLFQKLIRKKQWSVHGTKAAVRNDKTRAVASSY